MGSCFCWRPRTATQAPNPDDNLYKLVESADKGTKDHVNISILLILLSDIPLPALEILCRLCDLLRPYQTPPQEQPQRASREREESDTP